MTQLREASKIQPMKDMLTISSHLPERHFSPEEVVVSEGDTTGSIWVFVSGALEVRKGNTVVNSISRPGALIGEISVLLGVPKGATVVATSPSVLRFAADGHALLASDPEIVRLVAMGLAERLNFVTNYLADLKNQYLDTPGLAMVSEVVNELAQRQAVPARPGSARDPNPNY